ncbi:MAG: sulfatase [Acidobacteria bacterium]|nr:sulfatase [Acidobacteriota bacterium]
MKTGKTVFAVIIIIILTAIAAFLLFRSSEDINYENFDIINNFEKAEKTGLDTSEIINNGFKVDRKLYNKAFNRAIALGFSNTIKIVNYEKPEVFETTTTGDYGLWFKIKPHGIYNQRHSVIFGKVDDKNFYRITLLVKKEGHIKITETRNGTEKEIYSKDEKFSDQFKYIITVSLVRDKIVLTQGRVILDIIPRLIRSDHTSLVIEKSEVPKDSIYIIKYSKFSDSVIDILYNNLSVTNLQENRVWPISENSDKNLVYVGDSTVFRRAVAMPANSSFKIGIDRVPENSYLVFDYATVAENEDPSRQLKLQLNILTKNGDKLVSKELDSKTELTWSSQSESLSQLTGESIKVEFLVSTAMKFGYENNDIVFIANPVIRTKRKADDKNVLLISLDTLRADHLGCYGYKRDTSPNIDKLAAESVLFENAFTHSPWTLPAHASMLSSLYPLETGTVLGDDSYQITYSRLVDSVKTIAEYMKDNGYKTFAVTGGGWLSPTVGFNQGFEFYKKLKEKMPKTDIQDIISIARRAIDDSKDEKWFGFIHSYEIHEPYIRTHFEADPTDGKAAQVIANYDSGIHYADKEVGRLLDFLRAEGLLKNTIVIITSDHGEAFYKHETGEPESYKFGRHGHTMYDELLRVPLIIGGGIDQITKVHRNKNLVRLVDIMPTVLDVIGCEIPKDIRGISLVPIMTGDDTHDRLSFAECIKDLPEKEQKALRTTEYKLIHTPAIKDNDKFSRLYDLKNDPGEINDIASSKPAMTASLMKRMNTILNSIMENAKRIILSKDGKMDEDELRKELGKLGYLGN